MIVITGAAGFIASALAGRLNKLGYKDLILIDKWNNKAKRANYANKQYQLLVDRDIALNWFFVTRYSSIAAFSSTLG